MKYFKTLQQLSFHCTNLHCQLCHIKMLNHYFNIKLHTEREKLLKFLFLCHVFPCNILVHAVCHGREVLHHAGSTTDFGGLRK